MKNSIENIQAQLTEKESEFLQMIIDSYDSKDIVCYDKRLTASQKGIAGSLVKKGFIYDSYDGMEDEGNWFPSCDVLEAYNLPEHWPY